MNKNKCEICWKSFIWACPLLINILINIISCSAYEPTEVYLKEQELIHEFLDDLDPESDHELIEKWEKRL